MCADIPSYGGQMPLTGMCDTQGVITAGGTYLGEPTRSPMLRRVPGLTVTPVVRDGDSFSTQLSPAGYAGDDHVVSILLLDAATGEPLPVDYQSATSVTNDAATDSTTVTVEVPDDVALPERIEAIVMTDAFPARRTVFTEGER